MGARLTFDEATHTYRLDGRVVPSVTQILKRVYPDAYAGIPAAVLDRKARLGTAVHRAIDLFLRDELDELSLHDEVLPYFLCWREWWDSASWDEFASEAQFYCDHGGYAGTRDFFGARDSQTWLIDWKITSHPVRTHPIQLGGYHFADVKANRLANLYLSADGSPARLDEHDAARILPDWAATLRVYNVMETMK